MLSRAATTATLDEAHRVLGEFATVIKEDAQGRLGHYQDGWAPLAPATQADRERQGYAPDEPLLRSGALRDAITVREDGADFLVGIPADSDQAAIGRAQERGTLAIPPRPFIVPAAEAHAAEIGAAVGKAALIDVGIT
jgi:hypothetical protein